jgi:hypothetical protein
MSSNGFHRREAVRSLQQAASTIFVLMGLMPFLVFVYLAWILNVMNDLRVQLGLAAALAISMLGFAVLLSTMRKTSHVLQLLIRTETRVAAARSTDALPPAPARREPRASTGPVKAMHSAKSAAAAADDLAPAIGSIKELRDATEAVGRRWKGEAERLMGRAVRVGVANLDQPETGILTRTTDDGLVLEQGGQEFGVLWRFVSSVELYAARDPAVEATAPAG